MPPDEFYCWQALEKTGIYMIPGQVFDMKGSGNNFQWTFTTGKIWINKGANDITERFLKSSKFRPEVDGPC